MKSTQYHELLGKLKQKPQWDTTLHLTGWLQSKRQTKITSADKDVEKKESLCIVGRFINWNHYYKKQYGGSYKSKDFPGGSDGKASACNVGDPSLIPGLGRSPGDEMAIHSSTLAWKITWTEEPDRPQSMGSQRVEHDWATSLSLSQNQIELPWKRESVRYSVMSDS